MPIPMVAGNWKMHTTVGEGVALVKEMLDDLDLIQGVEIVLCPPFVSLSAIKALTDGSSVRVGAQNMHYEQQGAYTGEISASMIQGLCEYVILGHSERRHVFGESDEIIGKKVESAFRAGLQTILCVGERLEERENGMAEAVVTRQLQAALRGVHTLEPLIVAYEPVWAIGSGVAATPEAVVAIMCVIANFLNNHVGNQGIEVPQLYGGSVTPANVGEFVQEPIIRGVLVGGASLNAAGFVDITRQIARIKGRAI